MSDTDIVHSKRIAIGRICKAIGLQGFCGVKPFGNTLSKLSVPVDVSIGSSEQVTTLVTLQKIDIRPKGPACHFSGIESMEQADALRDYTIYIASDLLPDLGKEEYYHFDLIGLKVQDDTGNELGTITNVHNFPTVDSVEVDRGASHETLMLPLTADAVISIDQSTGYLTVRRSVIDELI